MPYRHAPNLSRSHTRRAFACQLPPQDFAGALTVKRFRQGVVGVCLRQTSARRSGAIDDPQTPSRWALLLFRVAIQILDTKRVYLNKIQEIVRIARDSWDFFVRSRDSLPQTGGSSASNSAARSHRPLECVNSALLPAAAKVTHPAVLLSSSASAFSQSSISFPGSKPRDCAL